MQLRFYKFLITREKTIVLSAKPSTEPVVLSPPLSHPMRLRVLTSNDPAAGLFGASRNNGRRGHTGIDLLAKVGDPVFSALPGRVSLIRDGSVGLGSGAMYLSVVHNAVLGGLVTRYMHLQNIAVTVNQDVGAGTQLGEIGRFSVVHLHFDYGRIIDPDPNTWVGGSENWKNGAQLVATTPLDPTRAMYDWEARLDGFEATSTNSQRLTEVGVLYKGGVPMFQARWGRHFYVVPLYDPRSGDLELVQTLRDAFQSNRKVRLASRDSVFFGDRKIITAVRVF